MATQWLDHKGMAALLNVSPHTVEQWGRDGRIPRLMLSPRCIRYDPDEVLAALRDERGEREKAARE